MTAITQALPNEITAIRHLAQTIWPDAYGDIISAQQIEYMLELFYSDEKLNQDFEAGQVFLMAKDGGEYIGFAAIEHHWKERPITRIHKIYILPGYQGKGVGRLLMGEIEARAKKNGSDTLSLNVNRENPAQEFYHHLGFKVVRSEDIDIGEGYLMEDFVMEKDLTAR